MNRSAFLRQARCGALGLGLVVWPAFSLAQAQTLPTVTADVVVTATTTPVPADTVGRSVYRLTREDLFLAGTSSLVDGLRLLPGIDARARGGRDVQTDFSLRGATFGQTLVLLDGVRLNDSQSGHHNGEIPAPLVGLDRVEVLAGPASAVHGADALGGTIQFVTRTDRHLSAEASVGEHRTIAGQLSTSGQLLPANWTMTAWGARSDGFMFDRDYALGGAGLRGRLTSGVIIDGRHQRRAFGANGFYGNSPSKEWTDGTILSAAWNRAGDGWFTQARLAGRNHGDHFRWDIKRPGFAENRHRTNAADLDLLASRIPSHRVRLNVGAGGGGDRITSSNLGEHTFGRGYGFAELLWTPTARVSAQAGARYDHYSTFGGAWSPSVSLSVVANDRIRLRGSAARAFRIPTFTERFYNDPAHLASDRLDPERGWAVDAGVDADLGGWTVSATPFVRWDEGVIDWVRQTTADRWRTTNVRDVTTTGVEVSAMRRWSRAMLRVHYSALDVDAPALTLLSKYVLEYATHSAGVSLAAPIGWNVQASVNADHRSRYDGQRYTLLGARLTRTMGRVDLFVEGSNLLDRVYREIAGVPMPGRWVSAGIRVR